MRNLWILASTVLVLGLFGATVRDMHDRVQRLESTPRADPTQVRALDGELRELSTRVENSLATLRAIASEQARSAGIGDQISKLQAELECASEDIAAQRTRISSWDAMRDEIGPEAIDVRVANLRLELDQQYAGLDDGVRRAMLSAESATSSVENIAKVLDRDTSRMWNDLLGPTVQLMGDETVGTGVLLHSEQVEGSDDYTTYVITAWHVIRDIQASPESTNRPVPVTIYSRDGDIRSETAHLLKYDSTLDVALLRLDSTRAVECGAKLAPRERLRQVAIFERIYAVGCPLGNDPIPTFGEIADTHHSVDGQHYWMISAPTYIGNSGGGVFDADTHELLGIFTKIYTHGTLRPTVVPHMGLATPLPMIYDWLEQVGYAKLEPVHDNGAKTAAANR